LHTLNLFTTTLFNPFNFNLMKQTKRICFVIIISLRLSLGPVLSFAGNDLNGDTLKTNQQNKEVRIYNTERLSTPKPIIDGVLDDACWKTGTWAGDYTQWVPTEGGIPSQPTFVKILYDDKSIYVAIRAIDKDPGKISRKAGRRDELTGDVAGICFDSYHDHRTGFEFDMTAGRQKIDMILNNSGFGDMNWNAVWYGKVASEDSAWTEEFEIPLSQLRYSNQYEQVWGLHVWRWIDRLQEESDWEKQSLTGPGILYLFGELHGIKGLKKSQRIELMPYSLGELKTFRKEPENPFANHGHRFLGNIGLDAKIGIGSNFTVDLTVNPDFGQVESDPSVMNLTAFETFYEEKRPFFLEGKSIFNFDMDDASVFYSRRIGHSPSFQPTLNDQEYIKNQDNTTILSAVKFSGKTSKGLSVGVLQSLTANEMATINSPSGNRKVSIEPFTSYVVASVQQDFNQSNTMLGGIFTSTNRYINNSDLNFLNRGAYTGGLDLMHYWKDKEYFLEAKVIGSDIQGSTEAIRDMQLSSARYFQRPDASHLSYDSTLTSLSGYGGKIKIGKGSKGLWKYSTEVGWRSPGLDLNDIGYLQTSDLIRQKNMLSYFINKPVSIFRTYTIGLEQANNWDFSGQYLSSEATLNISSDFKNKWGISNSLKYKNETLDNRILRGGYAMLIPSNWTEMFTLRTDQSKKVNMNLSTILSNSGEKSYHFNDYTAGISVRPINILLFSMNIDYSKKVDKLQYVDIKESNSLKRYILGQLNQEMLGLTFRIDYNITPEISIQYYGSPFATLGRYNDFKIITNARANDFYSRYQIIQNPILINNNEYKVDENNDHVVDYSFNKPDFNFNQFRSNLVFRWEYRPGSQFFLVWSNERTEWLNPGNEPLRSAPSRLANVAPNNIFLIKFNYWFSI
jgi:hypothetical protein